MLHRLYTNSNSIKITILIVVIVFTLFLFLQPRVDVSGTNTRKFLSYKARLEKDLTVNPQTFWEIREFYGKGSIEFNKNGLEKSKVQNILNELNISLKESNTHLFLLYSSANWQTVDVLVNSSDITQLIDLNNRHITKFTPTTIYIDESDKRQLYIFFVKPITELEQANGYFDYKEWDKELLKDRYWFSASVIRY